MNALPDSLNQAAWSQFWQVTLLIVFVAAITRLSAKNRPHLAHVLWLVVLIKCVTPPLWSSPAGVFCWLARGGSILGEQSQMLHASPSDSEESLDIVPQVSVTDGGDFASLATKTDDSPVLGHPRAAPLRSTTERREPGANSMVSTHWRTAVASYAAFIWVFGFLAIATVTTVRTCFHLRMIAESDRFENAGLDALVLALRNRIGLRQKVRLCISDGRVGPAVIGLLHPTMVLPEICVKDKSPEELEPLIVHELLHVRRGDLWTGMLQIIAQAIWWFHPLVWMVNRAVSREAERCCDEETIGELGCPPSRYARSLLEVLKRKRMLIPTAAFPGVRPVEITSKRLERIMSLEQGCHKRTPWWCRFLLMLTLLVSLPGGAIVIARGDKVADEANRLPRRPAEKRSERSPSSDNAANDHTANDADSQVFVARIYSTAAILKEAHAQLGQGEEETRNRLERFVRAVFRSTRQVEDGPGSSSNVPPTAARHAQHGETASAPVNDLKWFGDEMIVRATAAQHERISTMMDSFSRFGFGELTIEVRIATIPMELMKSVNDEWKLLSPPSSIKQPARRLGFGDVDSRGGSSHSEPSAASTNAKMVVAKDVPMMFAILDQERTDDVLSRLQGHTRANIMQCPTVKLFNGQTATVEDSSHRPFVVGVVDGQPRIRVVTEGLSMQLRPRRLREGSARLDCRLTLSEIRDVEEHTFGDAEQGIAIQVPEVATTTVDTSFDLPMEKTLLLSGLYREPKESSHSPTSLDAFRRFMMRSSGGSEPDESKEAILVLFRVSETKWAHTPGKDDSTPKSSMVGQGVRSDAGLIGHVALERETANDDNRDPAVVDEKLQVSDSREQAYASEPWGLTLTECLSIGLQNSKEIRTVATSWAKAGNIIFLGPGTRANSQDDFQLHVRNYVRDIAGAYWKLCFCYRDLEATRNGRDQALSTWRSIAATPRGGSVEAEDKAQSREQYFFFRTRVKEALGRLLAAERNLRKLIGVASSDNRLIRPNQDPPTEKTVFGSDPDLAEVLEKDSTLRQRKGQAISDHGRMLAAREESSAIESAYQAGTATLDRLLDAQRRHCDAAVSYFQSRVQYALALQPVLWRSKTSSTDRGIQVDGYLRAIVAGASDAG